MRIHKEGYGILSIALILLTGLDLLIYFLTDGSSTIFKVTTAALILFYIALVSFFREPKRSISINDNLIIAPADGKVVVIEPVVEDEYLKRECLQISIFMSPANVHINWFPVNGIVKFAKHHSGRFQAAFLPKASIENERTTVVVETANKIEILFRQVAGAMARRIVCYPKAGDKASQDIQMGFIKFGSRVDLYLPLDTKLKVTLGDKVKGSQTIIGEL